MSEQFSPLILGTMGFKEAESRDGFQSVVELIELAYQLGITTIDSADIYGGYLGEELLGRAIQASGINRNELRLVGKCGIKLIHPERPEHRVKSYDSSRKHILQSVEQTLKDLQTDYLDVLLIHRPDSLMEPQEVAEAFSELHASGKVRAFGVSNFSIAQQTWLQSALELPLEFNQIEFSPLYLTPLYDGTLESLQLSQTRPMAWSPFAGGRLFADGEVSQRLRDYLQQQGAELGLQTTELDILILAWMLRHPVRILPVLGTTNPARLERSVRAQEIELTREDWYAILTAIQGHEIP